MYKNHARAIQLAVGVGDIELAAVCKFVLATIRFPLWQAAAASRVLLTGDGDQHAAARQVLWGSKRKGWEFLDSEAGGACMHFTHKNERARLTALAQEDWKGAQFWEAQCLLELARIPGIGLVKAGFITQLAFGFGGCIDTHNLKQYNIAAKDVALGSVKLDGEVATKKALRYLKLCDSLGGAEELWNQWCEYVAHNQPKRYKSAYDVSAWHTVGVGI